MRGRTLLLAVALAGCHPKARPAPAPPPPDHTAGFALDHRDRTGCEACHGPGACVRCHQVHAPRDHGPGFAGLTHALFARLDARRCATCHRPSACARCHR